MRLAAFRGGRLYLWMVLVALAVGAISLAYHPAPSYDPWSWLIWGRQILHGQLHISGGSSWKPMPVIFTTVLALFGSAQPNLWLLIARAGAVLTVLMVVKVTLRVTWSLVKHGHDAGWLAQLSPGRRLVAVAPVLLAGAIALVCMVFATTFVTDMGLGYSEGVAFGVALLGAELAADGHHRAAFALGIVAALDRPEFWIIWAPYGLWLLWRQRHARPALVRILVLVGGLAVLAVLLWIVPQKLGGQSASSLITHPKQNHSSHSAVYSSFPFWHELSKTLWTLTTSHIEVMSLLTMAAAAVTTVRARRRGGSWSEALATHRAALAAAALGAVGWLWWLMIAVETQAGFAGNPRYALLGVMLIVISGAIGFGWLSLALARLAGSLLQRARERRHGQGAVGGGDAGPATRFGLRAACSTLVVTVVFVFVPGVFAAKFPSPRSILHVLSFQGDIRDQVASLTKRVGRNRILACGSVQTHSLEVTLVAWYLDVPISRVWSTPAGPLSNNAPNVIYQTADVHYVPPQPSAQQILHWEAGGMKYPTMIRTYPVVLFMSCPSPKA